MRSLLSARRFAECRNTGTRQRGSLPSAALGKGRLCRVPNTRQRGTLGKRPLCRVCGHMWRCLGFRHRTSQLARKLLNFLPQPLHAMTRHLDKFRDFRTSFAFCIIKNTFLTSWWSCFVKPMFEISRMSLHTASKYTQKHEYHFLNR